MNGSPAVERVGSRSRFSNPKREPMLVAVSHANWQLLRYALRAELAGQPPLLGRELRIVPSRRTVDGTFLDGLVAEGLLAVAVKAAPAKAGTAEWERQEPAQFRTQYKLTDRGRHAAEYGEYDVPYTPEPKPLTGIAAKLFGTNGEKGVDLKPFAQPAKRKPRK